MKQYLILIGTALLIILGSIQLSRGMPADDWLELVFALQQHEQSLDQTDRRFLRYMANWLAADEHAEPSPAQQRWLLDIKRRTDKMKNLKSN